METRVSPAVVVVVLLLVAAILVGLYYFVVVGDKAPQTEEAIPTGGIVVPSDGAPDTPAEIVPPEGNPGDNTADIPPTDGDTAGNVQDDADAGSRAPEKIDADSTEQPTD